MSIENQTTFYYRNVCDYSQDIKSDVALPESVISGFDEFSKLLREIYQDWQAFEISTVPSERTKIGIMTDDLENYHNLTYTLDCLFAISVVGELRSEGEIQYLRVNKPAFKSIYKKSAAFQLEMLEKHGFCFNYYKGGKEAADYKPCDRFDIYYENGSTLMGAMKLITERLIGMEKKKEMPDKVAFMLADYQFIFTGNINQDILQDSIPRTLGSLGYLWKELAQSLQRGSLVAESSFNPYVFPNRMVTFKQNKKTVCKFGINVDSLNIRLPLSFEAAKRLISKRASLPQSINQNIDLFCCVNCSKCENQSNIVMFEGVPLCSLPYSNFVTEDSRCLRFDITSKEEADVILNVLHEYN